MPPRWRRRPAGSKGSTPLGRPHANGHRDRRIGQQIVHQSGRRIVIEDAEAAVDHGLVVMPGDQLKPMRGDQLIASVP